MPSPQMSQFGDGMASRGGGVPSTPHPLQPPMVPIAPVFARPSTATSRDVKFETKPIMRGESEDTVLRPRGARGDDFWRRFSMVVKEDMATPAGQKQSMWLRKTQNGTSRMSRWVWFIGMVLLIVSTSLLVHLKRVFSNQNPDHCWCYRSRLVGFAQQQEPYCADGHRWKCRREGHCDCFLFHQRHCCNFIVRVILPRLANQHGCEAC